MAGEPPIPSPADWSSVSLKDVALKIGSGATPTGGESSYLRSRETVALIRSQNVHDRRFDRAGLAFISDAQALKLRGAAVRSGDILLNITGDGVTFARACIVPDEILPACVNQHVAIIRLDQRLAVPGFILSYLTHPAVKSYIEAFNSGGSRRAVTKGHIEAFRLPLPPLAEQRAIAHVLGTLDDKIELNRRMSETLEAMARALFKSWFVDFDPVRAKAEGRDPGLPPHLAALFPDRLVESGIGDIPEGWEISTLGDQYRVIRGLSYKGSGLADAGSPLHNLNSIYEGGGYKRDGIKFYTGEYAERHVVRPGELIVSNTEQGHDRRLIGHAALVPGTFDDLGIFSHHIFRLLSRKGGSLTPEYGNYLLNSPRMHGIVSGYANGTTINMLPIDAVQMPEVVIPPRELVEQFSAFVRGRMQQEDVLHSQSSTLTDLRDILLPKLVSGELPVGDAERFMERAA